MRIMHNQKKSWTAPELRSLSIDETRAGTGSRGDGGWELQS
jgi:hypothetical protein